MRSISASVCRPKPWWWNAPAIRSSANAPEFLTCLKARSSDLKIILAAADALGAIGAKQALAEIGLAINLITGPCTDTPAMRERTQALCGIPAINLARGFDQGTQSHLSGLAALV